MADPGATVSALVVARNEEAMLGECLASLGFADEIVVVLDRCEDRSAELARAAGARVIEGAWELEGERRNLGIEACASDWIVEIDADERVPEALRQEIRGHIAAAAPGVYYLPVRNFVGDREVVHGWGAYNGVSSAPRLFARGCKRWGLERVHPSIELKGARGSLRHGFVHLVDRDLADMFDRLNRYTTLLALDSVAAGRVPSLSTSLRRVFSRGWKSYVGRRGYREGFYGVALALFAGLVSLLTTLKAREIQARARGGDG
jgi:glycosyltransferase involved in cell wall biosynthesis